MIINIRLSVDTTTTTMSFRACFLDSKDNRSTTKDALNDIKNALQGIQGIMAWNLVINMFKVFTPPKHNNML